MKLLDWCKEHEDWGIILYKQFLGKYANGKDISITHINTSSKEKVLWKCDKGHIWAATVVNRVYNKTKCPFCSGREVIVGVNDLLTWCNNNTEIGDILKNEWDEHNGSMSNYTHGSGKKVNWICSTCKKDWVTDIHNRTANGNGCPYCNEKPSTGKSLFDWCSKNSTYGKLLLSQMMSDIDAKDISYSSHKYLVWKCNCGNIWKATVASRTYYMTGCPKCNRMSTSYGEQLIYRYYKERFECTISRGKYAGYEFDVAIPELKTCIEFNGITWHSDDRTIERDLEKQKLCKEHGVRLITIYQNDSLIDNVDNDYVYISSRLKNKEEAISLFILLDKLLGIDYSSDENVIKAMEKAFEFMNGA